MRTVLSVTADMTVSTSGTYAFVTSMKTGLTPSWTSGAMTVEKVHAGVTTSSPGLKPKQLSAIRLADEPELTMMPCCFEKSAETCRSNSSVRGPARGSRRAGPR